MEDILGHEDCKISSKQSFIGYYRPRKYQHDKDRMDANNSTDVDNNDRDDADCMHTGRIGLYCPACHSEWISPKFMTLRNTRNDNSLMTEGERYNLLTNKMYCDPNFRIPTESEDVEISKIRRGDHIFYNFMAGSMIHHAIVENVTTGDGGLRTFNLIHWRKKGLGKFELVNELNIDLQTKGPLKRRKYSSDYVGAENAELAIARATAMLHHLKYNLIKGNCEHFATFCKIGTFYSWQTWFALRMVTNVTATVLQGIKHAVHLVRMCAKVVVTKGSPVATARTDLAGHASMVTSSSLTHLLSASGIAVGLQVLYGVFNIALLYRDMRKGKLTKQELQRKVFEEVISTIERIFFTGFLPFAASFVLGTVLGGLAVTAPFSTAILLVPILALIAGSVISHRKRGFGRTKLGCFMNKLTEFTVQYKCSKVKSVGELSPGDHAVITRWMLHPRCHVIVVEVLKKENQLVVIRFKYDKGVVKETIKFCTPCCKVTHESKPFTPEEIIERGEGKVGKQHVYHIFNNNCKSFANWCVLGKQPKSVLSKVTYFY